MQTKSNIPEWVREEAVIDCTDVYEFAQMYRKPERFTAKGETYIQTIMDSHLRDIEMKGYTCISSHDNITGRFITYIPQTL